MKKQRTVSNKVLSVIVVLALVINTLPSALFSMLHDIFSGMTVSAEGYMTPSVHGTAPRYEGEDSLYKGDNAISPLPKTVTYKSGQSAPKHYSVSEFNKRSDGTRNSGLGFDVSEANTKIGRSGDNDEYKLMICDAADLDYYSQLTNSSISEEAEFYLKANVVLGNNIEWPLTGYTFNPIGNDSMPFTGEFDGQGFEIRDLKINDQNTTDTFGFFGATSNSAKIHDFGMYHPTLTTEHVGAEGAAIVSRNNGLIDNVYVIVDEFPSANNSSAGRICLDSLTKTVAGLVAVNSGTIKNSYFAGTLDFSKFDNITDLNVLNDKKFGVICAINTGTVENCYYDSQVFGQRSYNANISMLAAGNTTNYKVTGLTNYQIKCINSTENPTSMTGTRFKRIPAKVRGTKDNDDVYTGKSSNEEDYCYPRLYGFTGIGTENAPFLISTPAQLIYFPVSAEAMSQQNSYKTYFALANDIDMDEVAPYAYKPAERFRIITNNSAGEMINADKDYGWYTEMFGGSFTGTASGNNGFKFERIELGNDYKGNKLRSSYIIHNLTINDTYNNTDNMNLPRVNEDYRIVGFITRTSNKGGYRPIIKDIQFVGGNVYASDNGRTYTAAYVSAVSAVNTYIDLNNVHSSVDVLLGNVKTYIARVGGILAHGYYTKVFDCTNSGTISGGVRDLTIGNMEQNFRVGGLFGNAGAIQSLEGLSASAIAQGTSGFAGTVTHCANYGTVSGPFILSDSSDGNAMKPSSTIKDSPIIISGISTAMLASYSNSDTLPANDTKGDSEMVYTDETRSKDVANFGTITDIPVELNDDGTVKLYDITDANYDKKPNAPIIDSNKKSTVNASPKVTTHIMGISLDMNANTYNCGDIYVVNNSATFAYGIGSCITNAYNRNEGGTTGKLYNYNNYNKGNIYMYNGAAGASGIGLCSVYQSKNEGNINLYGGKIYTQLGTGVSKGVATKSYSNATTQTGLFQGVAALSYGCYNSGNIYLAPTQVVSFDGSGYVVYATGIGIIQALDNNYAELSSINKGNITFDCKTNKFTPIVENYSADYANVSLQGGATGKNVKNYGIITYTANDEDHSDSIFLRISGCGGVNGTRAYDISGSVNYADIFVDTKKTVKALNLIGCSGANLVKSDKIANFGDIYVNGIFDSGVSITACVSAAYNSEFSYCLNLGNVTLDKNARTNENLRVNAYNIVNYTNNVYYKYDWSYCMNGWNSSRAYPAEFVNNLSDDIKSVINNGLDPSKKYGEINVSGVAKYLNVEPYYIHYRPAVDKTGSSNELSLDSRIKHSINYGDINISEFFLSYSPSSQSTFISGLSSHGIMTDSANYGNINVNNLVSKNVIQRITGAASGERNVNYGNIDIHDCVFFRELLSNGSYDGSTVNIGGVCDTQAGNNLENRGNITVKDLYKATVYGTEYRSSSYGTSSKMEADSTEPRDGYSLYIGGISGTGTATHAFWNNYEWNNCINYGNISVDNTCMGVYCGGIINAQTSDIGSDILINHCINYGNMSMNNTSTRSFWVGGIIGHTSAEHRLFIKNSMNFGDISVRNPNSYILHQSNYNAPGLRAGGIIGGVDSGQGYKGYMTDCANYGNISYKNEGDNTGYSGTVSEGSSRAIILGGIIGSQNNVNYPSRVMNYGDITIGSEPNLNCYIGGIYGYAALATNQSLKQNTAGMINYGNIISEGFKTTGTLRYIGGIIGDFHALNTEDTTGGFRYAINYGKLDIKDVPTGENSDYYIRYFHKVGSLIGYMTLQGANYRAYSVNLHGFADLGEIDLHGNTVYKKRLIGQLDGGINVNNISGDKTLYCLNAENNNVDSSCDYVTRINTNYCNVTMDTSDKNGNTIGFFSEDFLFRSQMEDEENPFVYKTIDELSPYLAGYMKSRFGNDVPGAYVMSEGPRSSDINWPDSYIAGFRAGATSSSAYTDTGLISGSDKPLPTTGMKGIYKNYLESNSLHRTVKTDIEYFARQVKENEKSDLAEIFDMTLITPKYYFNTQTEQYEQFRSIRADVKSEYSDETENLIFTDIDISFPIEYLDNTKFKTTENGSEVTDATAVDVLLKEYLVSASEKATIKIYKGAQLANDTPADDNYPSTGIFDIASLQSALASSSDWSSSYTVGDILGAVSNDWSINLTNAKTSGNVRYNKLLGVITSESGNVRNVVTIHVMFNEVVPSAKLASVTIVTSRNTSTRTTNLVNNGIVTEEGKPSKSDDGLNDVTYYYLSDGNSTSGHNIVYYKSSFDSRIVIDTENLSTNNKIYVEGFRQDRVPKVESEAFNSNRDYNNWTNMNWNDDKTGSVVNWRDPVTKEYVLTESTADINSQGVAEITIGTVSEGSEMYYGGLYRFDLYYGIDSAGTKRKHFGSLFMWKEYSPENSIATSGSSKNNLDNVVLNATGDGVNYTSSGYAYKNASSTMKYGFNSVVFPILKTGVNYAQPSAKSYTVGEDSSKTGSQSTGITTTNASTTFKVSTDSIGVIDDGKDITLNNRIKSVTLYQDSNGSEYPVIYHGTFDVLSESVANKRLMNYDLIYCGSTNDTTGTMTNVSMGALASIVPSSYKLTAQSVQNGNASTVTLDSEYSGTQSVAVKWTSSNVNLYSKSENPNASDTHYQNDGFSTDTLRVFYKASNESSYTALSEQQIEEYFSVSVNDENVWTFTIKKDAPRGSFKMVPYFVYTNNLGMYSDNITFNVTPSSSDDGYYHWNIAYSPFIIENPQNSKSYLEAFNIDNSTGIPIIEEDSRNSVPASLSRVVYVSDDSADGDIVYDGYRAYETGDTRIDKFVITASISSSEAGSQLGFAVPYRAKLYKWNRDDISPIESNGSILDTNWNELSHITDSSVDNYEMKYSVPVNYGGVPVNGQYTTYYKVVSEDGLYSTVYTLNVVPEKRNKIVSLEVGTEAEVGELTETLRASLGQSYTQSGEVYQEILDNYGPVTATIKELGNSGVEYYQTKWLDGTTQNSTGHFSTYNLKTRIYDVSVDLPVGYDYDVVLLSAGKDNSQNLAASTNGYDGKRLVITSPDPQNIYLRIILRRNTESTTWGVQYISNTSKNGMIKNFIG